MDYYVIYQDSEGELFMSRFRARGLAIAFVEGKLESDRRYEPADFQIIHEQPLQHWVENYKENIRNQPIARILHRIKRRIIRKILHPDDKS